MADKYKYSADLLTFCTNLKSYIDSYDAQLSELAKLSERIESSSSWKDPVVKAHFVNSFNSYNKSFGIFKKDLDSFSEYVSKKAAEAAEIEQAFSKE